MFFFSTLFFLLMSLVTLGQAAKSGSGQATFFNPGMGACGHLNTDADFIVAVSVPVFTGFPGAGANPNANPICGKKLTATFKGNTVSATIVDECPGCAAEDIDLSPAAFSKLASLNAGRLSGVKWTIS